MADIRRIFSDPKTMNSEADDAFLEGLRSQFPIENDKFRLEASNFKVDKKQFTEQDEKDAILKSKSLTYPVRADLRLIDRATGKVVDTEHNFNLASAFHMTSKGTLVYGGSNYNIVNLLQLLPGVYTRSNDLGDVQSHWNTATGQSFTITLNPRTFLFSINPTSSASLIPLEPLISKVYGISPAEVYKYVPKDLWDVNVQTYESKANKVISDLYNKFVSTKLRKSGATPQEMAEAIRTSFASSQLSSRTTSITLGEAHTNVNGKSLLIAMKNLVDVNKGEREEDNRDSLAFKRVQSLPDYLKNRFLKDHETVAKARNRIKFGLDRMDPNSPTIRGGAGVRGILAAKPFDKVYTDYIIKSQHVNTPSETNPIESLEALGKVTLLGKGEGGISSEQSVPISARNIDPSHLGILDPSRTPESGHVGIDLRFTQSAGRDDAGNLYARVKDRDGKELYLDVAKMMSSVVGFPNQEGKKEVEAQVRGKIARVDADKVQYWLNDGTDMYTVTTNMVPFLNTNSPGRLTMAGKAIPQALSLVHREAPLIQTAYRDGKTFVRAFGRQISPTAHGNGVVQRVTSEYIQVRYDNGETEKFTLTKNLPFNQKGFFDTEKALVKEGDKVKAGTVLAENNYTKNGDLALGKNLHVAYIPYKGYNHEDGLVLSETAAKGLSSHHAYKFDYTVTPDTVQKKALVVRYFPKMFTPSQLAKLDENGFAKKGVKLEHGDPVYAILEKKEPSFEDKLLGRLHKTLVTPYRPVVEYWHHDELGEVVDSHTEARDVRILVRTQKELEPGDKLTGLHGNKGVVSSILPDHLMPYSAETGKPFDMLLNPASVTSRINLAQIAETALSKVAEKTGKPIVIRNFEYGKEKGVLPQVKEDLAKHGLKDTEGVIDPVTHKHLGDVLSGKQYILKLYKTTDQNLSARNVAGYDAWLQPSKGGDTGSKSVGYMEFLGLLGSNARANLREMSTIKAEKNDEFWDKFRTGQALPKPKTTFATERLFNYMRASGVNIRNNGGIISASPMTDNDILHMSHGELKNAKQLDSKNLEPEAGGLFDLAATGGLKGTHWSHYGLAEPILNPLFEKNGAHLLGVQQKELRQLTTGELGVKKVGDGKFHLINTQTGKVHRHLDLFHGVSEGADDDDDDAEVGLDDR